MHTSVIILADLCIQHTRVRRLFETLWQIHQNND